MLRDKVPCVHHRVVATKSFNSRTLLSSCYRVVVSSRLICTKSWFQNLRSLRTCFKNSFSTLLVFQIKCFLATRNFSYTCLQYSTCKCHCCTKHGVQNHNSHAVVEARPTWRNGLSLAWIMDRRSCLFFSSFSRNPVCCNQRFLLLGLTGPSGWLIWQITCDLASLCLFCVARNTVPSFAHV